MAKKRFWFSHQTAKRILPQLVEDYYSRQGIFQFSEKIFPELPLPKDIEWGSPEHFNWWFVTVMSDHAVKSKIHYPRSRLLYEAIQQEGSPNIFDPALASELEIEVIKSQLDRMCHGANSHPNALRDNSRRLVEDYDANPRNIFKYMGDVDEAKEVLRTFKQFRSGLAGLYLTFLVKYDLVQFDNPQDLVVKVDHHDIRVMESVGILNLREGEIIDEEVNAPLAEFMRDTCANLGLNVIDLDSIIWGIGVYGCSYKEPARCESACPLYQHCDREGMLGSYYKDGILRKGKYWNGETTKLHQGRFTSGHFVDLVPEVKTQLSVPKREAAAEQLDLFENG